MTSTNIKHVSKQLKLSIHTEIDSKHCPLPRAARVCTPEHYRSSRLHGFGMQNLDRIYVAIAIHTQKMQNNKLKIIKLSPGYWQSS